MVVYVADSSHGGVETPDKVMFAGKTLATTSKLATPWLLPHGLQAAVGEPHKTARVLALQAERPKVEHPSAEPLR